MVQGEKNYLSLETDKNTYHFSFCWEPSWEHKGSSLMYKVGLSWRENGRNKVEILIDDSILNSPNMYIFYYLR
jgi:hypothetical protein